MAMDLPILIPPAVKDKVPDPLVWITCPFDPSADGKVKVTFDATDAGDARAIKLVPLPVFSYG